jgi:hypothetical protein
MITAKINTKDLNKMLNNLIRYSDGFISETKAQQGYVNRKVANTSVNAFYQYLDGVARMHPGMLHHIYEWGEVGNPTARLVDLGITSSGRGSTITAEFLQSQTVRDGSSEPFYDKAQIMEEGIPVVIKEKEAQALFFEIDGVEYFRMGPITVLNPGGAETRGSFVEVFREFYNNYLTQVYLKAIRFYQHFQSPREYERNFKKALKSGNANALGKISALSWISKLPGEDEIDN